MVQVLSRINFTKINQNYEYFQIVWEQLIDEFNQKWSQKDVIFSKKAKIFPAPVASGGNAQCLLSPPMPNTVCFLPGGAPSLPPMTQALSNTNYNSSELSEASDSA